MHQCDTKKFHSNTKLSVTDEDCNTNHLFYKNVLQITILVTQNFVLQVKYVTSMYPTVTQNNVTTKVLQRTYLCGPSESWAARIAHTCSRFCL